MKLELTEEQFEALRKIVEMANDTITTDDEPLLDELNSMFKRPGA